MQVLVDAFNKERAETERAIKGTFSGYCVLICENLLTPLVCMYDVPTLCPCVRQNLGFLYTAPVSRPGWGRSRLL